LRLPEAIADRTALLVVAHPGHELRVHGWLELVRPQVWVLTDGSGHGASGRMASTTRLLAAAGAIRGRIYGRLRDRDAYQLLLEGDAAAVASLVEELAAALVAHEIDYVAGDACEGFNPVHDLCRLVIDAAVLLASRRNGHRIGNFEFALDAGPDWRGRGDEVCWELDDEALARKLAAARDYPELADEVERALQAHGAGAFRRERLHAVEPLRTLAGRFDGRPQYERFGEERVAAGHYTRVLRYDSHFSPLVAALLALLDLD
jgi:hypothetical protein